MAYKFAVAVFLACVASQGALADDTANEARLDNSPETTNDFHQCPALTPRSPAKSIRDLRPDDFKIIIGMGDSVMAALGARVPFGSVTVRDQVSFKFENHEDRGINYALGGDADAVSVGAITRHYSPGLQGLSNGTASFKFCYGPLCPQGTRLQPFEPEHYGLNAALSGAMTTTLDINREFQYLDENYKKIVSPELIKADPWKLALMEIGFNNICLAGCGKIGKLFERKLGVARYKEKVRTMIEGVRTRFNNTVLVIMGPFHINQIHSVIDVSPYCRTVRYLPIGCRCLDDVKGHFLKHHWQQLANTSDMYNDALKELEQEYAEKKDERFAVIYDPSLRDMDISGGSPSIFSGADCFHPSKKSHSRVGANVWNNLFLPADKKKTLDLKVPGEVYCAKDEDRIWIP